MGGLSGLGRLGLGCDGDGDEEGAGWLMVDDVMGYE